MSDATSQVDVLISVGSNITPEQSIPKALERLAERVALRAVSTFYRTPALGRPRQPDYLNGACRIATALPPRSLKFDVLRAIEGEMGRIRTEDAYASRAIDLDIALFGEMVVREPGVIIPDPSIVKRAFLALPLHELAPEAVLPDTGQPLSEAARALRTAGMTPATAFTEALRKSLNL
jgi:2-amino-4-hydroxy-6-hydroxymethyldihydropteridine diphosphokinase